MMYYYLLQKKWNKNEDHKLLEGIRLYNENWDLISKNVKRSIDECINEFISLPIEDNYFKNIKKPKIEYNESKFNDINNSIEEKINMIKFINNNINKLNNSINSIKDKINCININDNDKNDILNDINDIQHQTNNIKDIISNNII